jgi:hypothetical protein
MGPNRDQPGVAKAELGRSECRRCTGSLEPEGLAELSDRIPARASELERRSELVGLLRLVTSFLVPEIIRAVAIEEPNPSIAVSPSAPITDP